MRIKPLKTYRAPAYPTIETAGSVRDLLSCIPRRWKDSPRFSSLLGVGLMFKTLIAGAETSVPADTNAPVTQTPDHAGRVADTNDAVQQVQKATTIVAPVLAEALAYDGRGSFGCVAVSPPMILSEAEALDLIQKELKAAGLDIQQGVGLDQVMAPALGRSGFTRRTGLEQRPRLGSGQVVVRPAISTSNSSEFMAVRPAGKLSAHPPWGEPSELVSRQYVFDFADKGRSIFIEYLCTRDHDAWMGREMSTAYSYDFPALARKVSDAFGKRQSDRKTIFGVFFDPLAGVRLQGPDITDLDRAQGRMVQEEYRRAEKEASQHLHEKAREKLCRQVRHFIEFLRQEGLIKAAQPETARDRSKGQETHAPDAAPDQPM